MRFVDDFLLITREAELLKEFVSCMDAGITAYNCSTNKEKGGANYSISENGEPVIDKNGKNFSH